MATRRRRISYNQTLGDWKTGLSAHEINMRDANGNLPDPGETINMSGAGDVHTQMNDRLKLAQKADDEATAKAQQQKDYHALAASLGVNVDQQKDVWDASAQRYTRAKDTRPTYDQLKGAFLSKPLPEQAKIYASGGAQFIAPEDGAKLIAGLAKTREDSLNSNINAMGSQLARGEITHDPSDRKFYRTVTEPDPTNPLAAGVKKKVPITLLEAQFINEGMKRGMLPDIDSLTGGNLVPATTPAPVLAGAKTVVPPNGLENPPPVAPVITPPQSPDTATRWGNNIRAQVTGENTGAITQAGGYLTDALRQAPNDFLNAGKLGVNSLTSALNAVGRFTGAATGNEAAQIPQFDYTTKQSPLLSEFQQMDNARNTGIRPIPSRPLVPAVQPEGPTQADIVASIKQRAQQESPEDNAAYQQWLSDRGF